MIGGANETEAVARRPRERAPHVTEELAFDQRWRERAAVDCDEASFAPRQLVNRVREQLFSGARFAEQEHGDVRQCDSAERVDALRVDGKERSETGTKFIDLGAIEVDRARDGDGQIGAQHEECSPDLEDVAIPDELDGHALAVQVSAIERLEILDQPCRARSKEASVRRRHRPARHADEELALIAAACPLARALGASPDRDAAGARERVASPAGLDAVTLHHQKQIRLAREFFDATSRARRVVDGRAAGRHDEVILITALRGSCGLDCTADHNRLHFRVVG